MLGYIDIAPNCCEAFNNRLGLGLGLGLGYYYTVTVVKFIKFIFMHGWLVKISFFSADLVIIVVKPTRILLLHISIW